MDVTLVSFLLILMSYFSSGLFHLWDTVYFIVCEKMFFFVFSVKKDNAIAEDNKFLRHLINPSSANPEKWTNTLRQFVWVYVTILWGWRLRVKKKLTFHREKFHLTLPVPIPDEERKLTYIIVFTLLCGPSKDFINP